MTHFVYELWLNGEPMYVGMTKNLKSRLASHRRTRGLPDIQYGNVIEVCCYGAAADLEADQIIKRRLPWNSDRLTPKQKDPEKAALADARAIWLSPDNVGLTNDDVADLIPGWSAFMCLHWFGSRYGPTPGGRCVGKYDIDERIRFE